jgi:hypothetical protein
MNLIENKHVEVISGPTLLTEEQVAGMLGVSRSVLRGQRYRRVGLPFRKLAGNAVLYDLEDVKKYVFGNKIYTKDFPAPVSK